MSWKGVQGGKPEGEERMRGSALSSPMGVPLGYFHGYKKKGDNQGQGGVFEGCSHGFFSILLFILCDLFIVLKKTKGANQG